MKKESHDLTRVYRTSELVYSAYKRCRCGSGLAYPKSIEDPYYFWGCGYIMSTDIKFRPINKPIGPFDAGIILDEKGVQHDASFSFVFHEIAKEIPTSTTRPCEELVHARVCNKRKSKS